MSESGSYHKKVTEFTSAQFIVDYDEKYIDESPEGRCAYMNDIVPDAMLTGDHDRAPKGRVRVTVEFWPEVDE